MARMNCEMDLRKFNDYIGFWGGAKDRWNDMTEDEKDYLDSLIEDYEFDSITSVNDFIWFDSDELLDEYHKDSE